MEMCVKPKAGTWGLKVHNKNWKLDLHCSIDKRRELSSAVVASNFIICEYQVITDVNKYLLNESAYYRTLKLFILSSRLFTLKMKRNKKVLLRERKRHTARCVASTRCAALSGGGGESGSRSRGGTRSQVQGGTQSQVWGGTQSQVQGGYPIPGLGGTPSRPGQGDTPGTPPPRPGMGYSPYLDLGWVPPYLDLGWGTPLPRPRMGYPPRKCGQTENITSRHPSDAGGNDDTHIKITRHFQNDNSLQVKLSNIL